MGSDATPCGSAGSDLNLYMGDFEFTSLMIKNIPCKYTQEWLLEDIRAVSDGINFLQMPLTRRGDMCLGYAFVNFRTAEQARDFLVRFQGKSWHRRPKSTKRADISVANEQGFEANVQKFVSSQHESTSRVKPFVDYSQC